MLKLKLFIFLALIFANNMFAIQAMTHEDLPGTPESTRDSSRNSSLSSFNNSPISSRRFQGKNTLIASPTQTDTDRSHDHKRPRAESPSQIGPVSFRIKIDAPPAQDLEAQFYRACEDNDFKEARRALLNYCDNPWIIGEALKKANNPAIKDLLLKQLIATATEFETDNREKAGTIARLLEENNKLAAQLNATAPQKQDKNCVIQ